MNNKGGWILVAAALLFLAGYNIQQRKNKDVKDVRVSFITKENLEVGVRVEGEVLPKHSYNLYSEVSLVVDEVLVNLGEEVKEGQSLVKFSQGSVESVENQIRVLELDLKNTKLELSNLKSGSLQLDLDARILEIDGIESQIEGLKRVEKIVITELENLNQEVDAKLKLLEKNGISSMETNNALSRQARKSMEYENTKSELLLLQERLALTKLGYERLKREQEIQENMLTSRIEKIQLSLKQLRGKYIKDLKSPIDGVVGEVNVENGSPVTPAGKVMTVVTYDDFIVAVKVPVGIVGSLKTDMRAEITSRNNFEEKIYEGSVENIAKVITEVKQGGYRDRVIEVEISLEDPEGLQPGAPVDVNIYGNRTDMVEVVDAFSVIEENGQSYVFTVEEGIAKKQDVELGVKTYSKYQVLNLPEGTNIILNPFSIKNGDKVKIIN